MFTLEEISAAHAKIRTGADFPAFVEEIKTAGVMKQEFLVLNGTTVNYTIDERSLESSPAYPELEVAESADSRAFASILQHHQQGKSDFHEFCRESAAVGIEKWVCDYLTMKVTYFDKAEKAVLEESIPGV